MDRVRILGGGVAGLTAAIRLAKSGCPVEVYEVHSDCGARFAGDFQGLENFSSPVDVLNELKELDISVNFDCTPKDQVTLTDGYEIQVLETERPFVYMLRRGTMTGTLDQGLKQQAIAAGVRLHFGETRPESDVDIVATGPHAKKVFASAMGITFETSMEDTMIIMFNEEGAFRGYSYLGVRDGNGCICSVVFDDLKMQKGCFEETKRLFANLVDLDIRNPSPMSGVGSISVPPRFQSGSTSYSGEAAGLQDLLFGFGIRRAFESGAMVADCLLDGSDYESAAEARFGRHLKAGLVNRYLWEKLGGFKGMNAYRIRGAELFLRHPRWIYNFRFWHGLLWPMARRYFRRNYGERTDYQA